jgi:glyoxylase-like metal-dependent hydrolase (beta-lactamase superfamily II)
MSEPRITRYENGISAVGHAAFVDTGTTHSVPYLLAALDELGIERAAVDYLFITHVHLDHAGGAGALLKALPNARAVLHPRGAPHLIDPSKLIASAIKVYGADNYRRLYGELVPLPKERVIITSDLERLRLGTREFEFIFTPGHALHHQAIVDLAHAGIFTGDTFGLSYRELDTARGAFIVPTTTPTQFDPEQLIDSIDRLMAYQPRDLFLMHYSRVRDVPRLGSDLKHQVREFVRIALENAQREDRAAAIAAGMRELWQDQARAHGCALTAEQLEEILGKDVDLNVQGLVAWLERRKAA